MRRIFSRLARLPTVSCGLPTAVTMSGFNADSANPRRCRWLGLATVGREGQPWLPVALTPSRVASAKLSCVSFNRGSQPAAPVYVPIMVRFSGFSSN